MRKPKRAQYKRWLQYMLLGLVPLLCLWLLILGQSRRWALTITEQNTSGMLEKNATVIDQWMSTLTESISMLMNDAELNELLATSSFEDSVSLSSNQRELTSIISQYIHDQNHIASINLVASTYAFSFIDVTGMPSVFAPEAVAYYPALTQAAGKVLWFPTAQLSDVFHLSEPYSRYYQNDQVLCVGAQLQLSYVKSGYLYQHPQELPIMLVNIYPSVFNQWLRSEHLLSDSAYAIISDSGDLVYTSSDHPLPFEALQDFSSKASFSVSTDRLRDSEGQESIVCTQKLRSTGWTVLAWTPINEAFLYFGSDISMVSLIILLVTVLFVGIMVWLSTRSIVRPLQVLSTALRQTAQGNYAFRIVEKRYPDYQMAFASYNQMNEDIARLIHESYEIRLSEKNLEIQVINMQFNPHFLYNTLNTISLLALVNGQEQISDMLGRLSYMMRYSVKNQDSLVPLELDLKYIDAYVELMKLRSAYHFSYEKKIDPELYKQEVPKFLLQPFVENAMLHAFSDEKKQYELCISGYIKGNDIYLSVEDNGKGISEQEIETMWHKDAAKLGISNTAERIRLYYGAAYGVTIHSRLGKGTKVTIRIPYSPHGTEHL